MKTLILYASLIILIVVGLIVARQYASPATEQTTTKYDDFAQCLANAGAKFYGAFWCPHCADQKAMFEHTSKLPYVECSTPDKQGQTQICINENITGYPTWKFADGSVQNGVLQLSALAEKTNCQLPE